jgi:hypothetical protein
VHSTAPISCPQHSACFPIGLGGVWVLVLVISVFISKNSCLLTLFCIKDFFGPFISILSKKGILHAEVLDNVSVPKNV